MQKNIPDQTSNITIIGGGNLGRAIAEGLMASKFVKAAQLTVTRRKIELLADLSEQGVRVISENTKAVSEANIVILAVKPKVIHSILEEIKEFLKPNTILISVVTGVSLADIQAKVKAEITVFRAMPNTAVAIRESMTCISTQNAAQEEKELVLSLFDTVGKAIMIEDELMAASTVLGACGIAYALRYIRAASQGGIEIGFDAKTAQLIASQVVKGAAGLLLETGHHPEEEIDKVTTPQGCTIVGLNEMEHQGFSSSLIKGLKSSYLKIADIADTAKGK
jgi:pyrroline-5-carboxylate reductase